MALADGISDGTVMIRPPTDGDAPLIVAARDELTRRFLGDGEPAPSPTACIVVEGAVVGWVDYDHDRSWLEPDEVNVGYSVFPTERGNGYAARAVRLLLRHLADETAWQVATLLIAPDNARSLAVARKAGFTRVGDLDGNPYWNRAVAAITSPPQPSS